MSSLLLPTNPEGVPGTVLEALVAARNIAGRSGVAAGGDPMDGEGEGGEEKDKKEEEEAKRQQNKEDNQEDEITYSEYRPSKLKFG